MCAWGWGSGNFHAILCTGIFHWWIVNDVSSQYFSNSKLRRYKCKVNAFTCTEWPKFILGHNHLLNWSESRHLLWNFNHTCLLKLEPQSLGISFSYAWILFSPQIQPKQFNFVSTAATTQLFWKMVKILEEPLTSRYLITMRVSPDSYISTLSQFSSQVG